MRMKRCVLSVITLLLMTVDCSIPEFNIDAISSEMARNEVVFTAVSGEPKTKTVFQADETSIWWSPGDEIAIFYGASEGSKFTASNDAEVAKAEFHGKLKAFTGVTEGGSFNYFWAIYPYSSAVSCDGQSVVATLSDQQVAKAGSFAPNTNVSIAKSLGLALSFYNACAWFRFSVTKEGVKRVIFRGNNNEDIAGVFSITMGEDGRPLAPVVIDGKKEITLELPDNAVFEVGKMYYITLFPQIFENGFTVTFETDSQIGSRSIIAKATYLRSKYNTGYEFDKNIEYANCYNVGDIVDSDGKGVICWVSGDGGQVLLMSVNELKNQNWATSYNWCTSYGQSWRMPTIEELTKIHDNLSVINESLSKADYTQLNKAMICYWSSTVYPDHSNNYYIERLIDGLIYYDGVNSTKNYTRAVKTVQ